MRSLRILPLFAGLAALPVVASSQKSPDPLPAAVALYRTMQIDSAAAEFERIVEADPGNLDAKAYLADATRRQRNLDGAAVIAREVLAQDPSHGFAHVVLGACFDPVMGGMTGANADSAVAHYRLATQAKVPEGDGWLLQWKFAASSGDIARERELLKNVARIGYITPTAIAWGRAMLQGLPKNAVLLTNGDMDTYPPRIAQLVHGVRTDVAVVNLSLLNVPDYARSVARIHHLPLPKGVAESGMQAAPSLSSVIAQAWKQDAHDGRLSRPYFASVTVSDPTLVDLSDSTAVFPGPRVRIAGGGMVAGLTDLGLTKAWLLSFDPSKLSGHFVSEQDRSPVRQLYSDKLGLNFVPVYERIARQAIATRDGAIAKLALRRMQELRSAIVLGDSIEPHVNELRQKIADAKL